MKNVCVQKRKEKQSRKRKKEMIRIRQLRTNYFKVQLIALQKTGAKDLFELKITRFGLGQSAC